MSEILVDFRKYPDSQHWHYPMRRLGEDDHGTWLWAPKGTRAQRGNEPPITFEAPSAKLITDDWWSAIWSASPTTPGEWRVYVDIVAPAEWHEDSVRLIDLDLDVYRSLDGKVRMLDEDEFAEHQVQLGYPQELIDGAREAGDRLLAMVRDAVEPFDNVGVDWLAKAVALSSGTGS